jgi:hypothetical protein
LASIGTYLLVHHPQTNLESNFNIRKKNCIARPMIPYNPKTFKFPWYHIKP